MTQPGGQKQKMPRFYRDRIFTEEERTEYAESIQEKMFDLHMNEIKEVTNKGMNYFSYFNQIQDEAKARIQTYLRKKL